MAEQPTKPKRRPVDALFGDSDAPSVPPFSVEPPQPVKNIQPPPPGSAPEPETGRGASSRPESPPVLPDVPTFVPPAAPAPSTYASEPPSYRPPAYAGPPPSPHPLAAPPPEAGPVDYPTGADFIYIPDAIRRLYEQVHTNLADSPRATDLCMRALLDARAAYLNQDYASAEYYVEAAEAKLKRSMRSSAASRSLKMWLLWIWELGMLVAFTALIVITFVPGLTLFGVSVAPEMITLLRALGWGGLGGVLGALYNLSWFIQYREYDPAYTSSYVVRPLLGVLVGAILFLISQAGILAGNAFIPALPGTPGPTEIPVGPIFLFLFAILAGFKQEYVLEFFDNVLRAIFRLPRLPDEYTLPPPTRK